MPWTQSSPNVEEWHDDAQPTLAEHIAATRAAAANKPEPKQMTLAARCVRILGAGMKHGEVIDDLQVAFLQIHGKGKARSGDGSVDQVESLDVCLRQ